jgi:hypothetical protein
MNSSIFYNITPCSPLKDSQERVASIFKVDDHLLDASLLLGLFFDPEDGGDMFLRNGGRISMGYMMSYP